MIRINLLHYYEAPLPEYIRMVFEPTEEEVLDMSELPNVKERDEFERYEDDKILRTKARYCAVGHIPPPINKVLKPEMLSWVEHSTYDKAGQFWEWRIEPHFFKNALTCTGKMSLHEDGSKRTRKTTKGVLEIRIPIIGPLAERLIIDHLKQNFDAEVKIFHDRMKKWGRI